MSFVVYLRGTEAGFTIICLSNKPGTNFNKNVIRILRVTVPIRNSNCGEANDWTLDSIIRMRIVFASSRSEIIATPIGC